jgi:hypothetical protein
LIVLTPLNAGEDNASVWDTLRLSPASSRARSLLDFMRHAGLDLKRLTQGMIDLDDSPGRPATFFAQYEVWLNCIVRLEI